MDPDKISIVTVVFNSVNLIEDTIESVLNQDHSNWEYIVIDGASTDGTLEILSKYSDRIDKFISEEDHGIYDAMNKALALIEGSWVIFLNSGDRFYSNSVLSEVSFDSTYDLYFGVTRIESNGILNPIYRFPSSVDNIWKGMICCHQSIFFSSKLFKSHSFNTNYKLSADFELIYSLLIQGAKVFYIDSVISVYLEGGVSQTSYLKVLAENKSIVLSKQRGDFQRLLITLYYYLKLRWFEYKSLSVSK